MWSTSKRIKVSIKLKFTRHNFFVSSQHNIFILDLKKIKAPISKEMKLFEDKFQNSLNTKITLLDKVLHYLIKRKGKQIRPMFVFLCAKLFEKFDEKTYRAASMIELLHTATLVHDDVVDDANMRRGYFSVNAIWKNKIAVLVGDFLLSKGLLLAVNNEEFDLLKIMSKAVKQMSEGELLQIEKSRMLDITEEVYFDIIRKKTATLIGACCACGANSVGEDKNTIDKMYLFGETVGMAFQIKDDLFDYTESKLIGKPTGIDIRERKMTLPLIYTLNNADKKTRSFIINVIKNHNKNENEISRLIDLVKVSGGVKYAEERMNEFHLKSIELIANFKNNEAKSSLLSLLNFVITRKK